MSIVEQILSSESGTPFELTLSEAEVNGLIGQYLTGQGDFGLRAPRIQILPGQVVATGQARLGLKHMDVRLVLSPIRLNDAMWFAIDTVELGGAAAPGFIRNQVSQMIARKVDPATLPVVIEVVEIAEGSVRVAGRRR